MPLIGTSLSTRTSQKEAVMRPQFGSLRHRDSVIGRRSGGGEIVVESGVQVWHMLATLLDALAVDGGKEIHDLYGEAADLVTERV